jgi:hypothetical protein
MRRHLLAAALAVAAGFPSLTAAQEADAPPLGVVATFSLAGGGELGLDEGEGPAGVVEIEGLVGYEFSSGFRPELAVGIGLEPDGHVALRPGIRFTLPSFPLSFRVALDGSNARDRDFDWRWLLLGVAGELRFTSLLGLFAEVDTGAPLGSGTGLPLLVRGGASFRF